MQIRPKSLEQLTQQVEHAETQLGRKDVLVPSSLKREEFFKLSLEEIKSRFPIRYQAYVDALRAQQSRPPFQTTAEQKPFFQNSKEQFVSFLSILNGLDDYIQTHEERKETGQEVLRHGQITAFEAIRNDLEKGYTDGYVELPTGFGKTVIFSQLVDATRVRTVICVPTRQLVTQTYEKLKEFAPEAEVGRVYTDAKEREALVTVTTYDSLLNDLKNGRLDPNTIKLLVLDEAHKGLSDARRRAVASFQQAIKVGFTASPEYDEQKSLRQLLPREYISVDTKKAIEQGYLASCRAIVVKTHVDLASVDLKGEDYDPVALEKAVNVKGRNQAAVDLYKQAFQGKAGIAFCVGVKHAQDVAKEFQEQGFKAAAVSGNTDPKVLEKTIADYRVDKIDILCNANLLIEGFDADNATVCFNLAPTRSLVRAKQRAGRVLRLDERDPNKLAVVVDFVDEYAERKHPVLYPSILEGSVVLRRRNRGEAMQDKGEVFSDDVQADDIFVKRLKGVDLGEIEVVYEETAVLEVVRQSSELGLKERSDFQTYEVILPFVQAWAKEFEKEHGKMPIGDDYRSIAISKGWPVSPHKIYENKGWTGYDAYLGKEKRAEFPTYQAILPLVQAWAKEFEKEHGKMPGSKEYQSVATSKAWPSAPERTYEKQGWTGYDAYLGKEKR